MAKSLHRQRGFLLNPFRFASSGGGGGASADVLLHFDGTDGSDTIVDSGRHGLSVAVVGASGAIQTEVSRFGGASLGALTQRHVEGAHASVAFGTGDFTVEGWAYWEGVSGASQRGIWQVCTPAAGPAASTANLAAFINASSRWAFYTKAGVVGTGFDVPTVTWQHVAMARQAGVLRMFVAGALAAELADTSDYTGTGFAVGTYYSGAFRCDGYVDEFRITAGAALYTAAFTPPTAPFVA